MTPQRMIQVERLDGRAALLTRSLEQGKELALIREGTRVHWNWGNGRAEGTVTERLEETVTRTIDGTEVRRKGSADDPALLIRQDDGQIVLKLRSEVERAD